MSIFGNLRFDPIVQINEKTRLDASSSFINQDEMPITLVRIEAESAAGFIDVSALGVNPATDWFLDWGYATAGTKTVSLEITTDGAPSVSTYSVEVVLVADDALFANDDDLQKFEPDILKWLPTGRYTWNFIHRKVQEKILTEIYKNRIFADDGTKLEKTEVLDTSEVREWATFSALSMIFKGIQNASDDVFNQKSKDYDKKSNEFQQYSMNVLALDYNKDGNLSTSEKMDFRSGRLVRR